ncbi:cytochrome c oxidase assembly protein [Alteromonas sp. a30]|uniref:cytochrome c oxidase assembly protein n=1 Tax=Alteromonas sp. a30 TaxID=2730917 RepID=UPI002280C3B5|nr:cytochrome c oxidase assembly protein [Alteromonas sp. a30]MCY7295731.1 cytochrome c oxidase assembly protein [Alteromonas sp. a30]
MQPEEQSKGQRPPQSAKPNNAKLVGKLVVVVFGMFGFGFALVPLYDVFCDITGINGKTNDTAATYTNVEIDQSREVVVEFITRTNKQIPWEFEPVIKRMVVHPGEMYQADFVLRNSESRDVIAQAVPSVSPGQAALYLNKTECFCFEQQPLVAGQRVVMPMRFYVDPDLPKDIEVFTLNYTLYDVTGTTTGSTQMGQK